MKTFSWIFLASVLLTGGLFLNRECNKSQALQTESLCISDKVKATLIWHLDKEGLLWQKTSQNKDSKASWQRIWPDQLMMLIQDEKNMHDQKALVLLTVDPDCSFTLFWQLVQTCLQEKLSISLDGPSYAQ